MSKRMFPIVLIAALAIAVAPVAAEQYVAHDAKDNSLYEDLTGSLSNGAGNYIFAGQTAVFEGFVNRRALLAFDWERTSRWARPSQVSRCVCTA